MKFWSEMRRYWLDYWGLEATPTSTLVSSTFQQLLDQVEVTTRQTLQYERELDQRARASENSARDAQIQTMSRLLLGDALDLHAKLKTNLAEPDLCELSEFVHSHWTEVGLDRTPVHLTELTLTAIARRLQQESLKAGWDDFLSRAPRWPPPLGLSPHADAAERQAHLVLEQQRMRESFVNSSVLRLADLVVGRVPVWRDVFPERGGAVWQHSLFEMVAGGLAMVRLQELDRLAHQLRPAIEEQLTKTLAEPLLKLDESMRSPFGSEEITKRLAAEVAELCQRGAPELVWKMLSDRIRPS